jgi:hypothetical protein
MRKHMTLTDRQKEVLASVVSAGAVGSGADGAVLKALANKGLVIQNHNSAPGYVYYTWCATELGEAIVFDMRKAIFTV